VLFSTPVSFVFSTANSNSDPYQKDIAFPGTFTPTATVPLPFGDIVTGNTTYPQPAIPSITVGTCSAANTLSATVIDSLSITSSSTVGTALTSVKFFYQFDSDGDGKPDPSGTWTFIGDGSLPATTPVTTNPWSVTWNSTLLSSGQYFIKAVAVDNAGYTTDSVDAVDDAGANTAAGGDTFNPATLQSSPIASVFASFSNTCGAKPPTIDLDGDNTSGASGNDFKTTYTLGSSAVGIVDTNTPTTETFDTVITDTDSTQLSGAVVEITNAQPGDSLSISGSLPAGIKQGSGSTTTRIILTDPAALSSYEAALEQIQFSSTSGNVSDRNITVQVTDTTNLVSNVATTTIKVEAALTVSGTVFSDADANVVINGSDAGTNAGSNTLTVYAVNTNGKVVDKSAVSSTDGKYTLSKIPKNATITLRLSNDASLFSGDTAPTASSIPSDWYFTGQNKNGTVDGTIATLGNISLTTTTSNIIDQNFGIRQSYVLPAPPVPTTCDANFTTTLNTGVSSSGTKLAIGANDLNWTAEWIDGPGSGLYTPYATPRPVGVMPAVVVGNLAPGAWVNAPASVEWISYPFRLTNNSNGNHQDANLNGVNNQQNDTVRLRFIANVTLPGNAASINVSLPVGVSADNRFVSLKVNGVENLIPSPTQDAYAEDYRVNQTINIQNGWKSGVNTIEIIIDSGPPLAGFFLGVNATSTQVCSNANVLLVKRITAVNGDRIKNPNDNTPLNVTVDDTLTNDNNANWPNPKTSGISTFLQGVTNAGLVKPGDTIEYTVYFLNADAGDSSGLRICDRITNAQSLLTDAYGTVGSGKDIQLHKGDGTFTTWTSTATSDLTSATDAGDRARLVTTAGAPANCNLDMATGGATDTGTLIVDVVGPVTTNQPDWSSLSGSTGAGTANSYGYIRFTTKVDP
jgi:hypothetical protein